MWLSQSPLGVESGKMSEGQCEGPRNLAATEDKRKYGPSAEWGQQEQSTSRVRNIYADWTYTSLWDIMVCACKKQYVLKKLLMSL